MDQDNPLSFLEKATVHTPCQSDYLPRVLHFVHSLHTPAVSSTTDRGLDDTLTILADEAFFKEQSVEGLTRLVDALKPCCPALGTRGAATLPRMSRTITSLIRMTPSSQTLPLPMDAPAAMITFAVSHVS